MDVYPRLCIKVVWPRVDVEVFWAGFRRFRPAMPPTAHVPYLLPLGWVVFSREQPKAPEQPCVCAQTRLQQDCNGSEWVYFGPSFHVSLTAGAATE